MGRAAMVILLLGAASAARADVMAPEPIPERVATARMVVVGKVVQIEPKNVTAPATPGATNKVEYQVAVVKVEDGLLGARGLTHIRIGFVPNTNSKRRFPHLNLEVGQEALFFLTPHFQQPFQVFTMYFDVVNKKDNANFDKEVKQAREAAKVLADPLAALKSKDAAVRRRAAGMLVLHYRTPPRSAGPPKTEPIDATESKLILQTLADWDWKQRDPNAWQMTPQNLFLRLGLTEKDGWKQPGDFQQLPEAARQWLRDNFGKYRIQRYVWDTAPKKE